MSFIDSFNITRVIRRKSSAQEPAPRRVKKERNPAAHKHPWHVGTMLEDLMSIKKGEKVVFKKSVEKLAVGPTWWVMSEKSLFRVSENYGGESMKDLIRPVRDRETGEFLRAPAKIHSNYNRRAVNIQAAKQRPRPRKDLFFKETPVRASPL